MFVLDICIDCRSSEHKTVGVLLKCGTEGSEWPLFPSSLSQLELNYKKSLFSEINFSLTTGGLRQKQVLTVALSVRPSEMLNPRLLNTSRRGEGSWIGTSCVQTLGTGREKPPWKSIHGMPASPNCPPNDCSRPLLQGTSFVVPPCVTGREKKQDPIELWKFEVSVSDRRWQISKSQLPRLWTARSVFDVLGPKEIPGTGLLLGGYDYIINKEAETGQKWSINILLGNSASALKSDEDHEPIREFLGTGSIKQSEIEQPLGALCSHTVRELPGEIPNLSIGMERSYQSRKIVEFWKCCRLYPHSARASRTCNYRLLNLTSISAESRGS